MNALDDFVKKSAANYLQSVVFVDDKIYNQENDKPLEVSPVSSGTRRPKFFDVPDMADNSDIGNVPNPIVEQTTVAICEQPKVAATAFKEEETEKSTYHPRQLMESFAQQGIVCALYEPRRNFKTDPTSDLFRLCERADVIILDWDLYNDGGDGTSALLIELIKKSKEVHPHHVRLCTIYTDQTSLYRVVERLADKLQSSGCSFDMPDGKLHITVGATRIAVFGKPHSMGRPESEAEYEVNESELANKIISEFATLHHGLMPAFALHGLAVVRRNTKRLLDKFGSELDGAFLLHRALVLNFSEAFDELPELLADEIRAVLEDLWPSDLPLEDITACLVDNLSTKFSDPSWKKKDGQPYDAMTAVREMLLKGAKGLDNARRESNEVKNLEDDDFRGIKPAVLNDFDEMLKVGDKCYSEHLASLFCNRTQYGADKRFLRFGTIVRHKKKESDLWSFSVCLMPICDSQRLKSDKEFNFPFWMLKENVQDGVSMKRFGIVVVDAEKQAHRLAASGKIRDMLWIHKFVASSSRTVIALHNNQKFQFTTDGMIVEWVAELKPLHAQRIAAHMGAEVSRVGLVESEWLRLFCDR